MKLLGLSGMLKGESSCFSLVSPFVSTLGDPFLHSVKPFTSVTSPFPPHLLRLGVTGVAYFIKYGEKKRKKNKTRPGYPKSDY